MFRGLLLSIFLYAGTAGAVGSPVSGFGRAHDYCSGDFSISCINNTKSRAEREAIRDMEFRCRLDQGRYVMHAYCSSHCHPSWLPHDAPRTYIDCDADCRGTCER